jgi:hypothetical protein
VPFFSCPRNKRFLFVFWPTFFSQGYLLTVTKLLSVIIVDFDVTLVRHSDILHLPDTGERNGNNSGVAHQLLIYLNTLLIRFYFVSL